MVEDAPSTKQERLEANEVALALAVQPRELSQAEKQTAFASFSGVGRLEIELEQRVEQVGGEQSHQQECLGGKEPRTSLSADTSGLVPHRLLTAAVAH